jgi:GNAT superfamily N-acetyltransferase
MVEIREADVARDRAALEGLWLDYLTWGNDGLEARYGFRLPVRESVDHDLASLEKFQPPDGRLLLGFEGDAAVATAAMRRIGPETAEIKRMYVRPPHRGAGIGRRMLDVLIAAAREAAYDRIRLDSPHFMTAAHGLYRSSGFVEIAQYPESEIPERFRSHWIFMERALP